LAAVIPRLKIAPSKTAQFGNAEPTIIQSLQNDSIPLIWLEREHPMNLGLL
jgi:hypothetical protein